MVYTSPFAKRLQVGKRSLEVILGNGSCSWWVSHKQPTHFPYGVAGKCLIIISPKTADFRRLCILVCMSLSLVAATSFFGCKFHRSVLSLIFCKESAFCAFLNSII